MRKYAKTIIIPAAICSVLSCTGLRQAAKVQEPVEVSCDVDYRCTSPDRLCIKVSAQVPAQFRNPNTGILVIPVLCGQDSTQRVELEPVAVEGMLHRTFNARKGNYEPELCDSIENRSPYMKDHPAEASAASELPLEEWMKDSRVYVDVYADSYTRRIHLSSTSFPIKVEDLNSYADLEFKERYYYTEPDAAPEPDPEATMNGGFRFSLDSYSIEDGNIAASLKEYAEEALSSYRTEDYKVCVTVSNSPEGSTGHNSLLARNRLQAVKSLLTQAGVDTSKCIYTVIEENWDGVRKAISESTSENRDKILEIIGQEQDPDIREHRIRDEFYREWRQLRKETYPTLRFSEIGIVREIRPDTFSPEGEEAVVDACSLNDEMLGKIRSGEYDAALSIADNIPNRYCGQEIMSNKAMLYLKAGRTDEAKALLKRCPDIVEARHNLAVLYITEREYQLAEPLLEDSYSINKAVVKIALGKKEEARDILLMLEDSQEKDSLLEMTEE